MRPYTTPAVGSVAISDPVKIDFAQDDFKVGLSLNVVSGTNTSSIQYSLDDPDAVYATNYNTDATWYDVVGLDANAALNTLIRSAQTTQILFVMLRGLR